MVLATDMALWQGLAGGVLIGFSALVLFAGKGQIAGISGIVGRALAQPFQASWRWWFIVGMLTGAGAFLWANGSLNVRMPDFDWQLAVAAVLVGIGTRLGSGCTSGHGVCGIGRRSPRSISATVIFMTVAIVTVLIVGR